MTTKPDHAVPAAGAARVVGLGGFQTPTLEGIERRRGELLALTVVVLLAFAAMMALFTFVDVSPEWLASLGGSSNIVRAALVVLVVAFAAYLVDNERRMRAVSKYLVNEQVLSAALANRLKEISVLADAGKAVSSSLELDDVLAIILRAASELLEADEGSIMLAEGDELVVAAALGHAHLFVGDRRPITDGLAGMVARTRERILIEGRIDHEDLRESRADGGIRSAMLVPMQARNELLGVLNVNVTTGQRRYTEYELRALHLFAEHAAMAIRHARALTRERELRMHAVELDRVRTELVGTMAHDLKSPLTAIIGAAKILLQRAQQLDEHQRTQFVEAIERQAARLLALIERLLEAARSHVQQIPLAQGPIDLVPQVEELAASYSSAYGREIAVSAEEPHMIAYADPDAVEQVFGNLFENAMKHTPADATVSVRVHDAGDAVAVSVSDDGPGIPVEAQASIFAPFRRADSVRGSGLGLFVVSNLVRVMGGRVSLRSEPGRGCEFTVTLPKFAATAAEGVR